VLREDAPQCRQGYCVLGLLLITAVMRSCGRVGRRGRCWCRRWVRRGRVLPSAGAVAAARVRLPLRRPGPDAGRAAPQDLDQLTDLAVWEAELAADPAAVTLSLIGRVDQARIVVHGVAAAAIRCWSCWSCPCGS